MASPEYLTGNREAIKAFIDQFDVFLFDCDGVLWSGDHVFPGTVPTLELLRDHGKQVVFVTNNSTKSRQDYQAKLQKMDIPATAEEVFGSSYSASVYISRILPQLQKLSLDEFAAQTTTSSSSSSSLSSSSESSKKNVTVAEHIQKRPKVFVIGEAGIESELRAEGVPFLGGTDAAYRREITSEDYKSIAAGDPQILDPEVGVVLVGLDFHFNYLKICLAYHYITRNGAIFLATNIDSTLPSNGKLFAGAGTMSAPLIRMLDGREPLALGKPSQAMMDAVEGKFKFDRSRACMVGDRANTDIRFGIEGKLGGTLAVLTGVSSKQDFLEGDIRPKFYVDQLGDLLLAKDD